MEDCGGLQGITLMSLEEIYRFKALNQAEKILSDPRHPVFNAFEMIPSAGLLKYQDKTVVHTASDQTFE